MCDSQPNDNSHCERDNGQARLERIERNEAGQLVVKLQGVDEAIVDVHVVRCFPWSVPDSYISIRDADGQEIVMIEKIDALEGSMRELVAEELRDKVFNPKIRRIVDYKHEFGVASITAETDRGEVRFQIRGRDDVRILSPTRAFFRDADGNTYELPDLTKLDAGAQKDLGRYF